MVGNGMAAKFPHLPVHPLLRGMISYSVIWPTCSITQEYLDNGTTIGRANWARAARFGFFGAFCMAPLLYGWLKYSSRFFKQNNLLTAATRAAFEQVSYAPVAISYFFFGMSLMEMKPVDDCIQEVREKFWPTYKIGVVFWPAVQTMNFYLIAAKNRVVFVSAASFLWTVFMAHMKVQKKPEVRALKTSRRPV